MELLADAVRIAIVERYARLLSAVGREIGVRPLVLPNATCFPDRFTGDEESASQLVERMRVHAGLEDVPLGTRVVEADAPPREAGCSTAGCGVPAQASGATPRLVEQGEGWLLQIPEPELSHPVVLTTMIARALGHVLLLEALPAGTAPEQPVDLTADYAAVGLGFGPLLLEGSYIYAKSCGGPQIAQVTRAAPEELAVLAALFVAMGGHSVRRARAELGTTQSALLGEAHEWVRANPELVEALKAAPELVAAGGYAPRTESGWLTRLFARGKKAAPAAPAEPRERKADPRADEIRALVDEALAPLPSEAE